MKTQNIKGILSAALTIEPTVDQQQFLEKFAAFLSSNERFRVFILRGYAGTGKTTMMKTIVNAIPELNWKTVLIAPTGRAAKVLSNLTGKPGYTIHKRIYSRKSKEGYSYFELLPNLHTNTLFIIDESSMIGNEGGMVSQMFSQRHLLEDILRFIYRGKNCIALFVGDTAQLPPVGLDESPALDESYIAENYRLEVHSSELKQVVRQTAGSGILANATVIRSLLDSGQFIFPTIQLGFPDIQRIEGTGLQDELEWGFGNHGPDGVVVLTRSNKRANQFNQQIRSRIFWMENEINGGDLLMVVKNNYFWLPEDSPAGFIANGDMLKVQKVKGIKEMYGFRFADVEVRLCDYPGDPELEVKILLDTLSVEGPSLPAAQHKKLFEAISEDYAHEPDKRKRNELIFKDPYYNALQVKFGWSVTCHKAQGGQWPVVFVDQGYLTDEMMDREFLRWLYTAFTRATERLYLVNFNDKFF